MAFDFPNNPTEGQRFDPPDGMNYIFRYPAWEIFATASGGLPEAPTDGREYTRRGQDSSWRPISKQVLGLENVDNTSDINKPISSATQSALNTKEPNIAPGVALQYWTGGKTWASVSTLPISAATQGALDLKAPINSAALTGAPTAPTANPGTNTIQIATTAFVGSAISSALRQPSNVAPNMDGVAAAGTSALYSRSDHVHPSDTSRVRITGETMTGHLGLPTGPGAANAVRKDYVDQRDVDYYNVLNAADTAITNNVNTKLPIAGGQMTGKLTPLQSIGGIGDPNGYYSGLMIEGAGGGHAAHISFHRPGSFAAYFGLDSDNQWAVGGWSYGNARYKIWHEANFNAGATWNTSNFNPGAYMPVAGGHFTGSVSGAGYFHAAGLVYAGNGVSYFHQNNLLLNYSNQNFGNGGEGIILQFSPSYYFGWNAGNGYLTWRVANGKTCEWNCGVGYFSLIGYNGLQPGGGPWYDSSDERIKTVKGAYDKGLDDVLMLEPVRYVFKGNDTTEPPKFNEPLEPEVDPLMPKSPHEKYPAEEITSPYAKTRITGEEPTAPYENSPHYEEAMNDKEFIGFVAQQIEARWPEMITTRTAYIDGVEVTDLRDMNTGPLVFAFVNAFKQIHERLLALEAAR